MIDNYFQGQDDIRIMYIMAASNLINDIEPYLRLFHEFLLKHVIFEFIENKMSCKIVAIRFFGRPIAAEKAKIESM